MSKSLYYLIIIVFMIGLYGAGALSYNDFLLGNVCPKLIGIPACYIIFACFFIPFIVHVIDKYHFIYFVGTGTAFMIAFYGTVMQIIGVVECPKSEANIPMCFISLAIFTTLITLKLIILRKNRFNNWS